MNESRFFAMLLLDSLALAIESSANLAKCWPEEELINSHILGSSCRIFQSCNVFVVAFYVLIQEMAVEEFCIGKCSDEFVVRVLPMEKLMSCNGIEAAEESKDEVESKVFCPSLRFHLQKPSLTLSFLAKQSEGPNPNSSFYVNERMKRRPVSPIVVVDSLSLFRKVLLVLSIVHAHILGVDRVRKRKPYQTHEVSSQLVDKESYYNSNRTIEKRHDVAHEVHWVFLNE